MQGGDYYVPVPGQRMEDAVRRRFRERAAGKQLDEDAAFMLLRLLESNAEVMHENADLFADVSFLRDAGCTR